MATNNQIFEEKVWKPFNLKYYTEAALQAQNNCITLSRTILETLILKELKVQIVFKEKEDVIVSAKLLDIIKDMPDRKLFERLQKHFKGKKEEHIFTSLLKFNDEVRRVTAHNLGMIDGTSLKPKLEQMEKNHVALGYLIYQLTICEFSEEYAKKILQEKFNVRI